MTNPIKVQNVTLPPFLFQQNKSQRKQSISPSSTLDPTKIIAKRSKKSSFEQNGGIVFDSSSFAESDNFEESIPLIAKLISLGFKVYLLCKDQNDKYLTAPNSNITNLPKELKKLAKFDEESDYNLTSKLKISRDKTILMDFQKTEELKEYLKVKCQYNDELKSSDLEARLCFSLPNDHFDDEYRLNESGEEEKVVRHFSTKFKESTETPHVEEIFRHISDAEDGQSLEALNTYSIGGFVVEEMLYSKILGVDEVTAYDSLNLVTYSVLISTTNSLPDIQRELLNEILSSKIFKNKDISFAVTEHEDPYDEGYMDYFYPIIEIIISTNQFPDLQEQILEAFLEVIAKFKQDLVKKPNFIVKIQSLLASINHLPDIQEKIITEFSQNLKKPENIVHLLRNVSGLTKLKKDIINKYILDPDSEDIELKVILSSLKSASNLPELQDRIVNKYFDHIFSSKNFEYEYHYNSTRIFCNKSNIDEHGYENSTLSDIIRSLSQYPDLVEKFIDRFVNVEKRKLDELYNAEMRKVEFFYSLLKTLEPFSNLTNIQENIVRNHLLDSLENMDIYSSFLMELLSLTSKLPGLQQEIIEKYDFVKENLTIDTLSELLKSLENLPKLQKELIEKYDNDVIKNTNLSGLLKLLKSIKNLPWLQKEIIEKYLPEINSMYELDELISATPHLKVIHRRLIKENSDIINATGATWKLSFLGTVLSSQPVLYDHIVKDTDFIDDRLLVYLMSNVRPNEDIESDTKPTYLYISTLTKDNVGELERYKDHLSEVVLVRITELDNLERIEELLKLFPRICHFILPSDKLELFQEKYPNLSSESGDPDFDIAKLYQSRFRLETEKGKGEKSGVKTKKKEKLNWNIDDNETIPQKIFATILNDDEAPNPCIRTDFTVRDITLSLEHESYIPPESKLIKTNFGDKILTYEDIEDFKSRPKEDGLYYLMGAKLSKGKLTRLNSASDDEEFMGLHIKSLGKTNITIKKGDDGFFYAISNKNCNISFVTKTKRDKYLDYQSIPQGANRYIDKIREYFNNPNFKKVEEKGQKIPKYNPENHDKWFESMFYECLGVCRHRVAAVEYMLTKIQEEDPDPSQERNFRAIAINDNHEIIEVKHEGKWYPIDLGPEGEMIGTIDHTHGLQITQKEVPNTKVKVKVSSLLEQENETTTKLSDDLESRLREIIEPEKILRDETALLSESLASDERKILLIAKYKTEDHVSFILSHQSKDTQGKFFYIENPDDIGLDQSSIFIDPKGQASIKPTSRLEQFLLSINPDDIPRPLLIINWDNFDAKEKVALNSIIDRNPSLNGKELPQNLRIIGVTKSLTKDSSFLSRHDKVLRSNIATFSQQSETEDEDRTSYERIELEKVGDFNDEIFGRIYIKREHLEWKKSKFVKKLESGVKRIEISNISHEDFQQLELKLEKAKITGFLEYYGYRIKIDNDVKISLSNITKTYDFSEFNPSHYNITTQVTYDQLENPDSYHIVNQTLFNSLIYGKKIEDGLYEETEGLIEKSSQTNRVLNLFITSNLSSSQYSCMFKRAEKLGVTLNIKLARGIEVPKGLEYSKHELQEKESNPNKPRIIITNDAAEATNNIVDRVEDYTIIDVEDLTYQDLTRIDFEFDGSTLKNFRVIESELLTKLKDPKEKVILRGEFDPNLLEMMHPILLGHGDEFGQITNNLTFIVEDQNISNQVSEYDELSFLSKDSISFQHYESSSKSDPEIFIEDNSKFDSLEDDSLEQSNRFFNLRKQTFRKYLKDHSLLKLSGHSGVGKTRLIEEIRKDDDFDIYYELDSFEAFANDDSDRVKILFFDETNIEYTNHTKFSQLKKGGNREIFHNGKLYKLSPNHKIVFAGNDKSYGGGRIDQKLFEDGSIPEMQLEDFPVSYIYEVLLKQAIYDKSNIGQIVSLDDFKAECKKLIRQYREHNNKQKDSTKKLTVRELQEQALSFLSTRLTAEEERTIRSEFFVSTDATKDAEDSLRLAINIRKQQNQGYLTSQGMGTNAVLLQGDSGIGKSEMVKTILRQQEILPADLKTIIKPDKQYYYRIDPSLPIEKKKEIIIKAFNEGNMVIIDEINTCLDDGLEKILNAVLTGMHPDTKKPPNKPGFMMIATANGIEMEGRSFISPALRHRMVDVKMKSLKKYSDQDLSVIISHMMSKNDIIQNNSEIFIGEDGLKQLVKIFKLLQEEYNQYFNLRVFENILQDLFKDRIQEFEDNYINNPEIKDDLIKGFGGTYFREVLKDQKYIFEANTDHLDVSHNKKEGIVTVDCRNRPTAFRINRAMNDYLSSSEENKGLPISEQRLATIKQLGNDHTLKYSLKDWKGLLDSGKIEEKIIRNTGNRGVWI